MDATTYSKKWVPNSAGHIGAKACLEWIVQIVLALLLHCNPPSCIPANILTVTKSLHPNMNGVEELPGVSFVHECHSVLVIGT